jgi:dipeptidyl-peptidase 4
MKPSLRHTVCVITVLFSGILIDAQNNTRIPAERQSAAPGRSQLTAEDYARADESSPPRLFAKLKNGFVLPHWIGRQDDFWYKRDTAKGYEFVVVHAADGHKQAAFDHGQMAQAFSKASGKEVAAESLPFDDLDFSPDGSSVRVTVNNQTYDCKIKPATCSSGKPVFPPPPPDITFLRPDAKLPEIDPNEGILVSPDKQWGVFTQNNNLWLRNFKTHKDSSLTSDGVEHFGYGTYLGEYEEAAIPRERALQAGHRLLPMASYWSPDSRFVIVPRGDERFVADYPYVETAPEDGSFRPKLHNVRIPLTGEKPSTIEWFIFHIPSETGRLINLPYSKLTSDPSSGKQWWSVDNRHLYALVVGESEESVFLFDVDLATGNVRTMVEESMMPRMGTSSGVWDSPNVWVGPDGRDVIWFSERDGWGHLYLYDGQTGQLRNQITRGEWLVRDIVQVDAQKRRIYFTGSGREAGNPYYRYLYRINFDGSDLRLLSPEPAEHLIAAQDRQISLDFARSYKVVSPSGRFVVYNFSTPNQPPQTAIRSTETGDLISTFEKADATDLFAGHYRPPEEFVAKAADGITDLWSLVYKPSNFDPAKRYPVIDLEYAAPVIAVVPRNFVHAMRGIPYPVTDSMLAELGFIVVAIDARGTPYRSRRFSQAGYGQVDVMGLDDHMAVIKQLGERFSYVDTSRVGIMGGSFGGWSAFCGMLDFPDFFKVGVAGAPPGGWHNMNGSGMGVFQGPPIYSDGTHLRPKPDEVPENWMTIDIRRKAANMRGHLMVVMGELDENVAPGSTNQFLKALMEADKDFDLIYLTGTAHGLGKYRSYATRRIEDYLVRYLMGAEPPPR